MVKNKSHKNSEHHGEERVDRQWGTCNTHIIKKCYILVILMHDIRTNHEVESQEVEKSHPLVHHIIACLQHVRHNCLHFALHA